jgi:hypothetical protein
MVFLDINLKKKKIAYFAPCYPQSILLADFKENQILYSGFKIHTKNLRNKEKAIYRNGKIRGRKLESEKTRVYALSNLDYKFRSRIPSLVTAGIWGRQRSCWVALLPPWLFSFRFLERNGATSVTTSWAMQPAVVGSEKTNYNEVFGFVSGSQKPEPFIIKLRHTQPISLIISHYRKPPLHPTPTPYSVKICQNCTQHYIHTKTNTFYLSRSQPPLFLIGHYLLGCCCL